MRTNSLYSRHSLPDALPLSTAAACLVAEQQRQAWRLPLHRHQLSWRWQLHSAVRDGLQLDASACVKAQVGRQAGQRLAGTG